ncbi:UNVERIFIED_CONTAM: hypothetical protein HDU68_000746 [Siphonaria sp. JEL0065]|nr:hypothetical protein HDU68_000746 [Siphonaria sp. JEL0065]
MPTSSHSAIVIPSPTPYLIDGSSVPIKQDDDTTNQQQRRSTLVHLQHHRQHHVPPKISPHIQRLANAKAKSKSVELALLSKVDFKPFVLSEGKVVSSRSESCIGHVDPTSPTVLQDPNVQPFPKPKGNSPLSNSSSVTVNDAQPQEKVCVKVKCVLPMIDTVFFPSKIVGPIASRIPTITRSEPVLKSLAQQLTEKSYSLKRLTAVLNNSYPLLPKKPKNEELDTTTLEPFVVPTDSVEAVIESPVAAEEAAASVPSTNTKGNSLDAILVPSTSAKEATTIEHNNAVHRLRKPTLKTKHNRRQPPDRKPLIQPVEKSVIQKNEAVINILGQLIPPKRQHYPEYNCQQYPPICPHHSSSSFKLKPINKTLPVVSLNQQDQIVQLNKAEPTPEAPETSSSAPLSRPQSHREVLNRKLVFTHSFLSADSYATLQESEIEGGRDGAKDRIKRILEGGMVTPQRVLRSARLRRSVVAVAVEEGFNSVVALPALESNGGSDEGKIATRSLPLPQADVICIPKVGISVADATPPGLGRLPEDIRDAEALLADSSGVQAQTVDIMDVRESLEQSVEPPGDTTFETIQPTTIVSPMEYIDQIEPLSINTNPSLQPQEQAKTFLQHNQIAHDNHSNHQTQFQTYTATQIATHKTRMSLPTTNSNRPIIHVQNSLSGSVNEDLPEFPVKLDTQFRCGSSRPKSAYLRAIEKRFHETLAEPVRKPLGLFVERKGATIVSIDERLRAPVVPMVSGESSGVKGHDAQQQTLQRPKTAPATIKRARQRSLSTRSGSPTHNRSASARWMNRTPLGTGVVSVMSIAESCHEKSRPMTPQPLPATLNPVAIIAHSDGWDCSHYGDSVEYAELVLDEDITNLDRFQRPHSGGSGSAMKFPIYDAESSALPWASSVYPDNRRNASNPHFHHHHQYHHSHEDNIWRVDSSLKMRDHDLALQEYLDTLVHINFQNVESPFVPYSPSETTHTHDAKKKQHKKKRRPISGRPASMPKPTAVKSKTSTPKNSVVVRDSSSLSEKVESTEGSSPPESEGEESDTESLDLKYNLLEFEIAEDGGKNAGEVNSNVVPEWVDMFVSASVMMESQVVCIQRGWREYQREIKQSRFLDVVVYLQRLFRTRRVAQYFQRLRNIQKQKRNLGPSMKKFDELDRAAEILETGECRRSHSNAFAVVVLEHTKYLAAQKKAQEHADKISLQIENGVPRQSVDGRASIMKANTQDDGEIQEKEEWAKRVIQWRQQTLASMSEATSLIWAQYHRARESVDEKYPELRLQLMLFTYDALAYRLQMYRDDKAAPLQSNRQSYSAKRKSVALPLNPNTSVVIEVAIEEVTPIVEAKLLEAEIIVPALVERRASRHKELPFQHVVPVNRSRRPSATLPTAILEASPGGPEDEISLHLTPAPTSVAQSEDESSSNGNPPLLGNLIKKRQSTSAGRRTSVSFCLQHIDEDIRNAPEPLTRRVSESEVMQGRGSVISRRDEVVKRIKSWKEEQQQQLEQRSESIGTRSRPSTAGSKRGSVKGSRTKKSETIPQRQVNTFVDPAVERREQRRLARKKAFIKKKVGLRNDRVADALEKSGKRVTVESVIQFVVRARQELMLLRKSTRK